jgi:glycosyltransferase involved in cell wall biosynthesis
MIFSGLNDNALITHLTPIINSTRVRQVYVIRNQIGPKLQKVKYFTPRANSSFFRIFQKFFIGLRLGRKIGYIHSYYLIPHGLIACFVGRILKKKIGISLIGTDLDVHIKEKFYGKILLKLLKRFDLVTATGSNSVEYLKNIGINALVLPHCVDTNRFKANPLIKKEYDMLFVGRLSPEKRLDRIIEITNEVKKHKPCFRLLIVGSGSEEAKTLDLVRKLNLTETVEFVGFQEDVLQYYQKSKLLMLMSENEGSPLVLVECMACGVVPVVLDVGDIGDIVNKKNGTIFKEYNPKNISQSIISLLEGTCYIEMQNNALKIRHTKSINTGTLFWERQLKRVCDNDEKK